MKNDNYDTLKKVYKRGLFFQLSWSYERMQGIGFGAAITPVLEKVYKDDPEGMREALIRHTDFFNTSTIWGAYPILGIVSALEEEKAPAGVIQGLKTSLMGPLAGIGDTMNFAIILPILFSIPASIAMNDEPSTAIIVLLGIQVFMILGLSLVKWRLMKFGYEQGKKMTTSSLDFMKKLTFGSGVLGLTVVGGMIATMLKINTPISFLMNHNGVPLKFWTSAIPEGANAVVLNDILNTIIPKFLSLTTIASVYYLYKKKEWSPIKIIWVLMIVMFILGALRIIG